MIQSGAHEELHRKTTILEIIALAKSSFTLFVLVTEKVFIFLSGTSFESGLIVRYE